MSTRSRIGIELENGKVLSIYCHHDGYPAFNGVILATEYDRNRTYRLIQGGGISSLGTNIGVSSRDSDRPSDGLEDIETVYYYRDRHEGWDSNRPKVSESVEKYRRLFDFCGEEYAYLQRLDGKWEVSYKCGGLLVVRELEGEYLFGFMKKYWEA